MIYRSLLFELFPFVFSNFSIVQIVFDAEAMRDRRNEFLHFHIGQMLDIVEMNVFLLELPQILRWKAQLDE